MGPHPWATFLRNMGGGRTWWVSKATSAKSDLDAVPQTHLGVRQHPDAPTALAPGTVMPRRVPSSKHLQAGPKHLQKRVPGAGMINISVPDVSELIEQVVQSYLEMMDPSWVSELSLHGPGQLAEERRGEGEWIMEGGVVQMYVQMHRSPLRSTPATLAESGVCWAMLQFWLLDSMPFLHIHQLYYQVLHFGAAGLLLCWLWLWAASFIFRLLFSVLQI